GNDAERLEDLLDNLGVCRRIALVSEAGLPGVSDPGQRLIAAAIAAGVRVEVIPGASAAIAALVLSGFSTERFLFVGFPPRDEGPRRELFGGLRAEPATLIIYEAPPRVGATLADLTAALRSERPACVARELTKVHEQA